VFSNTFSISECIFKNCKSEIDGMLKLNNDIFFFIIFYRWSMYV
jgi:hypothetical protein